jgi:hypothetical protein
MQMIIFSQAGRTSGCSSCTYCLWRLPDPPRGRGAISAAGHNPADGSRSRHGAGAGPVGQQLGLGFKRPGREVRALKLTRLADCGRPRSVGAPPRSAPPPLSEGAAGACVRGSGGRGSECECGVRVGVQGVAMRPAPLRARGCVGAMGALSVSWAGCVQTTHSMGCGDR